MTLLLNYLICSILKEKANVVTMALKQRSKFEGWLKLELAQKLDEYFDDVQVEYYIKNQKSSFLIDIYADDSLVELKTPNTNYCVEKVESKKRPITDNVQSVINDIEKLGMLNRLNKNRYVAFVMFPIDSNKNYLTHINEILNNSNLSNYCTKEITVKEINLLVFTSKVL